MTEAELKALIKEGSCNLYVLYGEESYLTEQYARRIAATTVEPDFEAFNLQKFDGQGLSIEQLEGAVETLPIMADRKCVLVRDIEVNATNSDRLVALIDGLPDSCVLVFWQMTVRPNKTQNAWKTFLAAAAKAGCVTVFDRKSPADVAKMLVAGAKRRGCALDPSDAKHLIERAGNDLQLLLGEIDKLTALAGEGGTVTRELINRAAIQNLETKVFDLSKAILSRRAGEAYTLLAGLAQQREEPVAVLGVLSSAYADMYRAKVASAAGLPATAPMEVYKQAYKSGKEFRLRNAGQNAARMSIPTLRDCLDRLARADRAMKNGADGWLTLEQTVAGLLAAGRV